jgi:hypothetical protein
MLSIRGIKIANIVAVINPSDIFVVKYLANDL